MKPELLHILQHSLGVDQYGQGNQYRNHFATGIDGADYPLCVALATDGYMRDTGPVEMWGGMRCFIVTDAGKEAMIQNSPNPPKISRSKQRYQDFLHADCGMTFIEWIKRRTMPTQNHEGER